MCINFIETAGPGGIIREERTKMEPDQYIELLQNEVIKQVKACTDSDVLDVINKIFMED